MTTTTTPFADQIPSAVAEYFDAIDHGRPEDAAAAFTADGRYAVPRPGVHETDPRTETVGQRELVSRFRERGMQPWRHVVVTSVRDGPDGLLEGLLVDRAAVQLGAFAASFRLGPDGRIARYLAFATTDVPDPDSVTLPSDPPSTDALDVVERYFQALDEGRFEEAAACFSPDTMYSHPPYRHTGLDGGGRVVFRGRAELLAAFGRRGRTTFEHEVLVSVQRGPHCLLEGIVRGLPDGGDGSFVSSLSLSADGTIQRYVSFYCEPAVRWGP